MSNLGLFIAGLIVTFLFAGGALIHGLVSQGGSDAETENESSASSGD